MKWLWVLFLILFVVFQYQLWIEHGNVFTALHLQKSLEAQQKRNAELTLRNQRLVAEVNALREDKEAIQAQARKELGLIKDNEVYYQIVKKSKH